MNFIMFTFRKISKSIKKVFPVKLLFIGCIFFQSGLFLNSIEAVLVESKKIVNETKSSGQIISFVHSFPSFSDNIKIQSYNSSAHSTYSPTDPPPTDKHVKSVIKWNSTAISFSESGWPNEITTTIQLPAVSEFKEMVKDKELPVDITVGPGASTYTLKYYVFQVTCTFTAPENEGTGTKSFHGFADDPVNTYNGNMINTATDISIPGRIPIEFTRTYNSMFMYNGPLGYGWTHSYDIYLEEEDNGEINVFWGDKSVWKFTRNADGTYTRPPGFFAELIKETDKYKLKLKNGLVYSFDYTPVEYLNFFRRRLLSITNRNGYSINLSYDSTYSLRLYSVTDSSNRAITFTYYGDGKIKTITDPENKIYTYTYDPNEDLVDIQSSVGGYHATYTYTDHQMTSKNDAHCPKGQIEGSFEYYSSGENAGKVKIAKDGLGFGTTFNYNTNQTSIIDRRGYTEIHEYDTAGRLIKITDPLGKITAYEWDSDLNRTKITDAKGNVTEYGTFDYGNPPYVKVKDPAGNVISHTIYTYNTTFKDLVELVTDGFNSTIVTDYEYNANNGSLEKIKNPTGYGEINYVYYTETDHPEWKGLLKSVTDAKGFTTIYEEYDSYGNLKQVKVPINAAAIRYSITDYSYYNSGILGLLYERTDPEVNNRRLKTRYEYTLNNQIQYIYSSYGTPAQTYVEYVYGDTHFNRTDVYDEKRVRTHYVYDKNDQLTDVYTDYTSDTIYATRTRCVYDGNGNRTHTYQAYTEPEQVHIEYTYYENNRLKTVETIGRTPNSDKVTYTYEDNGNLKTKTYYDSAGTERILTYTYNALNMLKSDGTLNYVYSCDLDYTGQRDSQSNRVKMTDTNGDTLYTYDLMNRLLTVTEPATRNGITTTYTYDLNGNRQTMTITNVLGYSNGLAWSYTYWDNNWLKSVTDPDGKQTVYDYYDTGDHKTVTYPNGITGTYSFKDYTYRLGTILWQNNYGTIFHQFNYAQYDPVGNIEQMYDETGSKTYTYDDLGQLTNVYGDVEHPSQESFTYDDAGNRLTYTPNIGGSPYNYVYNKANELTTGAGITYIYDLNGNQKSKQIVASGEQWIYQYDYKNQLTQITYPSTPVKTNTFVYDGDGRRTKFTDKDGRVTNYYWDGQNVVLELDGSNNVTAIYTNGLELISKTYTWNSGKKSKFYYLYDHLGNTRAITDEWGNLVNTYYYDAFGKCWNVTKDPGNKNQYVGGYGVTQDEDSGLLYMRARYYDSSIGRFNTRDPIGIFGSLNLYTYCKGNPINYLDPSGMNRAEYNTFQSLIALSIATPYPGDELAVFGIGVLIIGGGFIASQIANTINDNFSAIIQSPINGPPNSKQKFPTGRGGFTIRHYGPDGRAVKDIDFGHNHRGMGDPHVHEWDYSGRKPERIARPATEEEKKEVEENK